MGQANGGICIVTNTFVLETVTEACIGVQDTALRQWHAVQVGDSEWIVFRRPADDAVAEGTMKYTWHGTVNGAEREIRKMVLRDVVEYVVACYLSADGPPDTKR